MPYKNYEQDRDAILLARKLRITTSVAKEMLKSPVVRLLHSWGPNWLGACGSQHKKEYRRMAN